MRTKRSNANIVGGVPALLFLVGVVALYWIFPPEPQGSTDGIADKTADTTTHLSVTPATQTDSQTDKLESVENLVDGLKQRVEQQPDDVKGWVLLAKSYQYLQRWDEASAAWERAKSLGYTGPEPSNTDDHNPHQSRDTFDQQNVLMPLIENAITR